MHTPSPPPATVPSMPAGGALWGRFAVTVVASVLLLAGPLLASRAAGAGEGIARAEPGPVLLGGLQPSWEVVTDPGVSCATELGDGLTNQLITCGPWSVVSDSRRGTVEDIDLMLVRALRAALGAPLPGEVTVGTPVPLSVPGAPELDYRVTSTVTEVLDGDRRAAAVGFTTRGHPGELVTAVVLAQDDAAVAAAVAALTDGAQAEEVDG